MTEIQQALFAMQDVSYRKFQLGLMPTVPREKVIGVRTPALREYAKRLAKDRDATQRFLAVLPHAYYEENNLHAALIGHVRDFDTALLEVERFLPYLDNWATCDSFAPKALLQKPEILLDRIREWLHSPHTYTARFGLVRLTGWYLDDPLFSSEILELAASVTHEDYYVRMAVAWFFSIALIKQYDDALPYLTECRLSPWIHNKAIQKARESYCVKPEIKAYLATLKIKERSIHP
ncbi:MAG: DNA alkylation repair protein [Clostridia bacterium]|nr:DNA alkylation repair protein [Clostridia bacterium]